MIASTVMIIGMVGYLVKCRPTQKLIYIPASMIVGGGIGNMIDRLFYGESFGNGTVVDFLDFCLINFPIFNVADCFVCVGAALLFLAFILDWRREIKEEAAKRSSEEDHDTAGA